MKTKGLQKVKKVILSGGILLTGLLTFGFSEKASAHGYVESPASRSYLCKQGVNVNCGPIQYEPQSVEGIGGFPANLGTLRMVKSQELAISLL